MVNIAVAVQTIGVLVLLVLCISIVLGVIDLIGILGRKLKSLWEN